MAGFSKADVPMRTLPGGAVPNPGTQQQELANITAPAEWNVFEFVVTCGACHAGTVNQQTAHFANWAGGNMASAARDPVFRAAQISTNDTVKAVTGQDGAGNVCFRCHSPNGWLSGRFDPTLGGKADGSAMIQSILLSTDSEGISCETCHRAVGGVTTQRADVKVNAETGLLDKAWNLLAGLFDWEHAGKEPVDQAGTPTMAAGNPYGDTTLQFLDGMTYIGKYSGMTDVYFSDLPIGGSYTGQIYAVYPDTWVADGNPVNPVPAGQPEFNSAGQKLAYNLDGTLPPLFELPRGTPLNPSGTPNFASQAFSIEHPTVGGAGRGGKMPFVNNGVARNDLVPPLPAGPASSPSPNEYIRTSEFCGACHDLTVPVLNHGMPEQRTYSEWKYSAYSKASNTIADPLNKRVGNGEERCQDCHMPTLKHEYTDLDAGSYNADPWLVGGFPYGKDRAAQGGTTIHELTGSNRDLPLMMKALYPEVDLEIIGAPTGKDPRVFPGMLSDRSPMFDRAKNNTEITLRDGVDVKISQPPTEIVGAPGTFEFKVKVTNKSGHRIPSGYPDGRRFWLAVQAKDVNGTPVYESGVYDAAAAELKTTESIAFKRSLGNVIDATNPLNNAVQVYERITGTCTANGAAIFPDPTAASPTACSPSPSVLNNFILFDNRIPPKGFDAAAARNAGVKFWNYGANYVPIEDGARYSAAQLDGGFDEVTYRFTAQSGMVLTASAEVQWQTHSREFMEHLRTADTSTVSPEGPPNPLDPNYPNVPNYLRNSINGLPLSSYAALDGSALNDNWGGVAYAAWLATGKGAPFMVDRDDTAVLAAPAAPVLTVRALNAGDTQFIDPVTLAPDIFAAKFSWAPVPQADGYTIWIRYGKNAATADWDRLVTVGKDVTSHTEHVLGDASVYSPGKTYGFKVVAFNGKGETASPVVDHTVASGVPLAPTLMTASNLAPDSTSTQVQLTWFDNATNEAGFEVWRYGPISVNGVPVVYNGLPPLTILGGSPAAGGGVGTQTGAPAIAGQTETGTNSYTDTTGLLPTACYTYQVRAFSANLDVSTFSLAPTQGCTVAGAPTVNLTATATGNRVDLVWTSNVTGAVNYRVTRTLPVAQAPVLLPSTTMNYADASVAPGTTYTYKVEAMGAGNAILATATTTVTTLAVPLAPSGATVVANGVQVTVSWTDNANNESGFVVERAPVTNGVVGAYQQVPGVGAFLAPNTVSFLDTSPLEAQTAAYRVKAINLVTGDSGYANTNQVTVGLFAPANVAAVAIVPPPPNSQTNSIRVNVSWVDVSQKETTYKVERQGLIGNNWVVVAAALPANSQSFQDAFNDAGNARTLQYRVTALAGALSSQPALSSVVIPGRPNNSPTPTVNVATGTSLNVNFTLPAGSVAYQLQRRVGNNGAWTNLGSNLGTGSITVVDTGLTNGTSYSYQLKVANTGGWSNNWSNTSSGSTLMPAPGSVTVTRVANATSATVSWTDNSTGETGFRVERKTQTGTCTTNGNWGNSTTATANAVSRNMTGLSAASTYCFRVRANATSNSAWAYSTTAQ